MNPVKTQTSEDTVHNSGRIDGSIQKQGQPKRYSELDSMRGLAALTVFFSHFVMGNVITGPVCVALRMSPAHIIWDGSSAVIFFFVLSGFVLALPYINNRERYLELLSFYFKRTLRIFPAFIFAILFSVALKEWLYDPHINIQNYSGWLNSFWKWNINENIIQLRNTLIMIGPGYNTDLFNPVIWSLTVEMNISFLIPFLILSIKKNDFVFNILFILVLIYLGIHIWIVVFYVGIMLARYSSLLGSYIARASSLLMTLSFIAAIVLYTCRSTFRIVDWEIYPTYITTLGSCLFIILALYNDGFSRFLKNKVCTFLGKVSYSFYLVHLPILITVASLFPYRNDYSLIPVFFISLSSALAISFLMYKYIETPFQKLSHNIVSKYAFWKKLNSNDYLRKISQSQIIFKSKYGFYCCLKKNM